MKKKLDVLLIFDSPMPKPRGYTFADEFKLDDWKTENDVYQALCANGHHVRLLGMCRELNILLDEIREHAPDAVFNLAEVFDNKAFLDKNIVCVLEMLNLPYTGSSPATMMVCNDKALHKKILRFHRIRVPRFHDFYRGRRVWLPKRLKLPLIVKPLTDEASRGISLASIIDNAEALTERVQFIHEKMNMDAIVEEYIDGREIYVSVMGTRRIVVLPHREMKFGNSTDDEPRIATYKAKWDEQYRRKWGIKNIFAGKLPEGVEAVINETCKRAYRTLNMDCYARFDIRVAQNGCVYILEANANPNLGRDDELAQSAEKAGISYEQLIQRILLMAFQRR